MVNDISANKRFELGLKIQAIELKDENFSQMRRSYERSLEHFQSNFVRLSSESEESLYMTLQAGNQGVTQILERNQEITQRLNQYVIDQMEDLDMITRRIRQMFDDEREELIRERNQLPWE
ncbi:MULTISPECIES: hypothetical protein [Lactococcus]|uniref:hypothetical protein n=1 Tax=Lactococcus TaxID=1357 RepID=UPI00203D7388|nr:MULTISPECIES: hypothetical protein [Lactococcus]